MYAYRDKAVANETALSLGIIGRKRYYQYFKNCMGNPAFRAGILKCISGYLPIIKLENDEI